MANKLPTEMREEIASIQRDITYPAFLGVLRHQDDTLESRGGTKSYKLYDDIERDCHAYGVLNKRKLAVIARPWQVDPASDDPLDKRAAEIVQRQLADIGVPALDNPGEQVAVPTNFDTVCYNLLDGLLKGFAVGEIMWDTDGSEIVAREIRPRDQRRFAFDIEHKLRLKTFQSMVTGEPVPARKFVAHSFGGKDGSPYGLGLGAKLFWPTLFKREDITFWLTFLDKFGTPTAVGKYPPGTTPSDQQKLLDALAAIAQDAGVTMPDGMMIELLEATRGGTVSYEQFCRYMDEQMSYAVLGEAAGAKDSGGALASSAILRNEVRLELVQADADLLSATLNSTLSAWITQLNVPGARPPKIWRQVKATEDLKARSERDKNLFALGFRPTLAHVQETYGGEWEEVQKKPAVPTPGTEVPAEFAEGEHFPDQAALDAAIDTFPGDKLDEAMRAALKPLIADLAEYGNLDAAYQRLADAFPKLDTEALEDMLSRAIFVADLWGRLNAGD